MLASVNLYSFLTYFLASYYLYDKQRRIVMNPEQKVFYELRTKIDCAFGSCLDSRRIEKQDKIQASSIE